MSRYAILAAPVAALWLCSAATAAHPGADGLLAFASNRSGQTELYVANPDGGNRRALGAQGNSPQWSPDGTRIAFASNRDGNNEIYVMNADGSGQTRLTFNDVYDSRPQWTADGSQLVFTRLVDGNWEVFRMDADGGNQVDLTNDPSVEWSQATSPQGKKIVFTREENGIGHLFTMTTDGKSVRRLTNSDSYDSYPSWSPSGNQILFTRNDDLWAVDANGKDTHQLTHLAATQSVLNGSWSPDGARIVYTTCNLVTFDHCTLHTANADGSGDTEISTPRIPFLDTFSGDRLDPFWGIPFVTGGGVSLRQANGEVEISVPSAATVDPQFGYISLGIEGECRLVGDFDVQVDYRLLTPFAPNALNMELATHTPDFSVFAGIFVFNPGAGTAISTHFPGPVNAFAFAPETSGSLRLRRTGSSWTAYRLDTGGWVAMQTIDSTTQDQFANLNVFSNAPQFSHPDTTVAYDNFRIASGTFACPTWWNDQNADWR